MELKPKTVKNVVVGWNVMFAGHKSSEELAFLCGKFMQHLRSVYSDEAFRIAAGLVERETNFFPTVKQMLDVRESVNQIRQKHIAADLSRKALPEETGNLTEDEIAQNLKRIEIIKKQMAGKMSMEAAEREQKKLTTYTQRRA
jgi:hypothetical protein